MGKKIRRVVIEIDPEKISAERLAKKAADDTSLNEFGKAIKKHEKLSKVLRRKP